MKRSKKINIYTNSKPRGLPIDRLSYKDEHIIKIAIYCENEVSKFKYFRSWYDEETDEKILYPKIKEIEESELKNYITAPNNAL